MSQLRRFVTLTLGGLLICLASSCSAMQQLGGQTISQTFSDERVVALVQAAVAGDSKRVAQLTSQGADINAIGSNGATPLLWALNAKNHQGIDALLKAGANPNLLTAKVGNSPMYFAAMADDPELLRLLLKSGGNPNHPEQGKIKDRPLSQAASEGRLENMKALIEAGADVNAHDQFNYSAAFATLALGKFEATALLLEHGFNFDLPYLARGVKVCQVPDGSEAQHWKDKVIVMLKDRGVIL